MKWGGYNSGAADRLGGLLKRFLSGRVLGALVTLSALALLLGASAKWNP